MFSLVWLIGSHHSTILIICASKKCFKRDLECCPVPVFCFKVMYNPLRSSIQHLRCLAGNVLSETYGSFICWKTPKNELISLHSITGSAVRGCAMDCRGREFDLWCSSYKLPTEVDKSHVWSKCFLKFFSITHLHCGRSAHCESSQHELRAVPLSKQTATGCLTLTVRASLSCLSLCSSFWSPSLSVTLCYSLS